MEIGIILVALMALLLLGVPIAFACGLVGIGGMLLAMGYGSAVGQIARIGFGTLNSVTLVTIPMFIFMAELIVYAGIGEALFDVANKWLSKLPGGLGIATIFSCTGFATVTGSNVAAAATMGRVAIPQMLSHGYQKRLAAGVISGGAGLAHLIPPSIIACIYAMVVQVSVAHLFAAGLVPGLVCAALYCVTILGMVLHNPKLAPRAAGVSWKERFTSLLRIGYGIAVILAVLGSIFLGIATPSESAALGALVVLLIAMVRHEMTWSRFWQACVSTLKTTSFILTIVVGVNIMNFMLSYLQIPQHVALAASRLPIPGLALIGLFQLMYIVMGTFVDPLGMVLLTMPVIQPILQALGFDLVWFGVLLLINIEVAVITPPVGFVLFTVHGIFPEISFNDIVMGSMPFMIVDCVVIALVMFFPAIALWLPGVLFG